MLLILIIIGSIFMSLWTVLNVKYIKDGVSTAAGWSSTIVLGSSFLTASLYLLLLWLVLWILGYVRFPSNYAFWLALAVTVGLNVICETMRFKAYSLSPVAMVAPFRAFSPVLTILTSWLIISELPTLGGTAGIILIVASIYFLHFQGNFSLANVIAPFRAIWKDRGTRYAFLAAIPPAVSIVFDKKAIIASDPFSFTFLAVFFIGLGAWVVVFFAQGKASFIEQMRAVRIKRLLPIGFFHFLGNTAASMTLLMDVVPHISALRRLVIVFEVVFGYYLLKQREDIKKRLIGAAGVVIGVILIAVFR